MQKERLKLDALEKIEKERTRIARDLHDNLGAELSLISSKIDIQSFKNKNTALQVELDQISTISKSANHQLRETIWSINQPRINHGELVRKIKEYGERIFENSEVSFETSTTSEDIDLSPVVGLYLFRICQEAINNSFKYGNASTVFVSLKPNELIVGDNGVGFDITTVRQGYGLNNIKERVAEIDGTLKIESNSEGTKVIVSFSHLKNEFD